MRPKYKKLFSAILPGIIVAGLIFGANIYYDLDLGKVIVEQITRIVGMFETTATTTLATISGYVGIKTATPTEALTVSGNILATGNLTISGGQITGANAEQLLLGVTNDIVNVVRGGSTYIICDSSGNCQSSTGGYIGGSGTSGYIPKFTGTYTIGNSIITDNGTLVTISGQLQTTGTTTLATSGGNVGIGTTAPSQKLHVVGNALITGTGTFQTSPLTIGNLVLSHSGLTASRTFTFPDVSDTLVSLTATQTLTNKTLSTGSTWQGNVISVTYGGTGLSSVASGALLYGSGSTALNTLPIGAAGTILTSSGSAPQWSTLSSLNIPTGTGTANTIAKWTGTNSLGNSIITDDGSLVTVSGQFRATGTTTLATSGGNVGIGTTTPNQKLTVAGGSMSFISGGLSNPTVAFGTTQAASLAELLGFYVYDTSSGYQGWAGAIGVGGESGGWGAKTLRIQVPDGGGNVIDALTIKGGTGNVGIGTTGPGSRLDVRVSSSLTNIAAYKIDLTRSTDSGYLFYGASSRNLRNAPSLYINEAYDSLAVIYRYVGADSAYWDETRTLGEWGGSARTLLADTSDIIYFGRGGTFSELYFDIATAGAGYSLVWEYWNGSAWTTLTVTDGTSGFSADGWVTWTTPGNWATVAVGPDTTARYYVRVRTTTTPTTVATAYFSNIGGFQYAYGSIRGVFSDRERFRLDQYGQIVSYVSEGRTPFIAYRDEPRITTLGGNGFYYGSQRNIDSASALYLDIARWSLDSIFYYDGAAFTDRTAALRQWGGSAYTLLADTDDVFYFGDGSKFSELYFDIGTAGAGYSLVWEYWNGTAWTSLNVSDGTKGFSKDGWVFWTAPGDWATNAVNGVTKYWVRVRTTTAPTTVATANFADISGFSGHFARFYDQNYEKLRIDYLGQLYTAGVIYPGSSAEGGTIQTSNYIAGTATGIGIGTTAPVSLLELYKTGASPILTITAATSTTYSPQIAFRTGTTPTTKFTLGVDISTGKLKIVPSSDITTSTGITIDSSGNVGIGTTAPNAKLEVAGTLRLTPITQSAAGACNASTKGAMYFDSDAGSYYYCDGTSWTKFKFTQDVYVQDADAQATALMNKSDAEGATILMSWDAGFAAQVLNSSNLSASKAASILDNSNLSASKAASILDNSNLSVSKAASILDNSNLSASKAASILDNSNLSVSKAASILDNSSLSASKAYSILTNANLSANKAQSIMYAMTNYAKQIDIITYGAPSTTTATTTISGVTRWSNVTTTAGTTLTLDGQPNVIIANTLTNYGTMDKTKTGGAGGRAADGAGAGGTGGGGVIIIVKNFVSSGTIQANGSSGGNAYGSTWNNYGDGGGAGNINRIGTHTLGSGGAGSVYNSGGGGPNGSASAGYGGVSGGSGGSVTYTTINTASDLYHQLRKAAIDWWLQNVASKTPSTTISFPNSYGSGGGGGGNYCSGSPNWNYYSGGGGGGSGGQVIVLADSLNNTGTIKANGGNGGNGWSYNEGIGGGGGGGGGGIVYALYRTTLVSAGTLQAVGGSGGSGRAGYGGPGGTGVATTLSVSGADIAENYPTDDPTIGPGDLVRIKSGILNELGGMLQGKDFLAEKYLIEKTDKPYDPQMIGVISVDPAIVLGEKGKENLRPVALVGRVPVKVTTKNGEILVGDYLTSSDIPGVAMKATKPGRVIGIALESYSGPPDQIGWITVFLNPHFVLGTINDNGDFEELFKEIENASTTQSETSILEKFLALIKSALEKLDLFIENGIAKVKEIITEKLTAEIVVTKEIKTERITTNEIQIVDKATGEIYCTWIENGEWKKVKGECETASNQTANSEQLNSEQSSSEQSSTTESSTNSSSTSTTGQLNNEATSSEQLNSEQSTTPTTSTDSTTTPSQ